MCNIRILCSLCECLLPCSTFISIPHSRIAVIAHTPSTPTKALSTTMEFMKLPVTISAPRFFSAVALVGLRVSIRTSFPISKRQRAAALHPVDQSRLSRNMFFFAYPPTTPPPDLSESVCKSFACVPSQNGTVPVRLHPHHATCFFCSIVTSTGVIPVP